MTKLISAGIAGIAVLSTAFAIVLTSSTSASAQVYGGSYGYNNGVPNGYGSYDAGGYTYRPYYN